MTQEWLFFSLVVFISLVIDLFIHRKPRPIRLKEALLWSGFWISLALLFNIYIYFSRGKLDALNFLTGYLIEKSLSVDNLFVFLLIFNYFKTPPSSQHKVLFWGVIGAMIMRAIFIFLGITLVQKFQWMIYIFGVFLIFTGVKLGLEKNKKIDPEKNLLIIFTRKIFPIIHSYKKDRFFIAGKATPLFLVLIAIETTDVIFAIDSIPAILAITYDPFIVYTSNIFAILGLRSLFFVLAHMMGLFQHLHYALSLILVFVGVKMVLSETIHIPVGIALGVVFFILSIGIFWSMVFKNKK